MADATCDPGPPALLLPAWQSLPISSVQVLLLLGPAVVCAAVFRVADVLGVEYGADADAATAGRRALSLTRASMRALVDSCAGLGVVLAAAFLAEYAPVYEHAAKAPSLDMFLFLLLLFGAAAYVLTTRRAGRRRGSSGGGLAASPVVLSREITEEWKGGMQIAILLYHYFKVGAAYNAVRVCITAYVWLTGFGHLMYFSPPASRNPTPPPPTQQHVSTTPATTSPAAAAPATTTAAAAVTAAPTATRTPPTTPGGGSTMTSPPPVRSTVTPVRFVQTLWRLNFLALALAMATNNSYILYYICAVHTLQFVLVFSLMAAGPATRTALRWKIAAGGVILFALYDLPQPWTAFGPALGWVFPRAKALCGMHGDSPCPVGGGGAQWEWYFRTHLDHWVIFLGMVFAFHYPRVAGWFRRLDVAASSGQSGGGRAGAHVVRAAVAAATLLGFGLWWTELHSLAKFEYNAVHPYMGWVPVLAYVVLRNLWPSARGHFLGLLQDVGKITLELYLLQHHLWLSSHAKTLLVAVPGFPLVNLAVVTLGFVLAARQASRATLTLKSLLLPDSTARCAVGVAVLAAMFGATRVAATAFAHRPLPVASVADGTLAYAGVDMGLATTVTASGLILAVALFMLLPRQQQQQQQQQQQPSHQQHQPQPQQQGKERHQQGEQEEERQHERGRGGVGGDARAGGANAVAFTAVAFAATLCLALAVWRPQWVPAAAHVESASTVAGAAARAAAAAEAESHATAEAIEPAELLSWGVVQRMQAKRVGGLADPAAGLAVLVAGLAVLFFGGD